MILICTETLSAGGAEIFLMNWATYANQNGINTSILCFHSRLDKKKSIEKHLSDTMVYYPFKNKKWDLFIARLDSLVAKIGLKFSLRELRLKKRIHAIVKKEKIHVVHSHLFPTDLLVAKSNLPNKVKHFTTIHGDYLRHYTTDKEKRKIKNFEEKLALIKAKLNGIIVISDKQLDFFKNDLNWSGKITKIYNGFIFSPPKNLKGNCDKFVIGMVSRGIKEKGWKEACEAFIAAGIENSELRLIGESDYLAELQKEYQSQSNIHFLGYRPDPLDEIIKFDLALLPSYYGSESLPTVLIEYFHCGIPVIATNIGEVPQMMHTENGKAGIIIENGSKPVSIDKLANAILDIQGDEMNRNNYKKCSKECAKKFNIEICVSNYLSFYKS